MLFRFSFSAIKMIVASLFGLFLVEILFVMLDVTSSSHIMREREREGERYRAQASFKTPHISKFVRTKIGS